MLDILIKNGSVIDGSGSAAKTLDIAIQNGKITEMAANIKATAKQTINAEGHMVTPGFIDIQNHSDSYWTIFDQPEQASLLSQGITSIVMGNCGASLAPLLTNESIKSIQKWHSLSGININWTTVAEFLDVMSKKVLGVNVGTLVGHSTLRRGLVKDDIRELSGEELLILDKSLGDALDQGALGLSMGLVYSHEMDSSVQELRQLASKLKSSNKYLSVHLRSEAGHILEAMDEVIALAKFSGIPLKISHLKIRGKKNWPLFEKITEKLEAAYHQGVSISFDVYPYDTSWSILYTYLPKWAYEGGRTKIIQALGDPMIRRKILDYLKEQSHDFGNIIIAEAAGNANFEGKSIRQIAQNQSVSNEEALINVIVASYAQVIVFDHNLSEEHLEKFMISPFSMIATDGAGYSESIKGLIHPRCFGTMPRFLRLVREKKLMKWEQAIAKITSEPAKLIGTKNRGILAVGNQADVTIFDPMAITDKSTYEHPDILSEGIEGVIVNGQLSYTPDKVLSAAGTVIKR
jgi:N-acyl-D-amino-acid deacylase